ncbi:MAG: hypothetical protein AVDCRST_MAG42-631 [uncultured Chthoniobacterales bacterium]|uniref:DinB-like domain-containing protein n=1 Tax=uncultured Chthoniobacterales bacterium TaxID=1836801 RepID=A0A6J4HH64_9BACT|nr:MAG: hypothetical protein AVDCRST_MAG42-631 [uncultured Chthoniobacterales bacterium]
MRNTLLLATVGVLAVTALRAAAETKASAGTATLTEQERERGVSYLEETRREFLSAVAGLSEEQWKFKSAPERWSIAETAEHIAVSEGTIWQLVSEKLMKMPPTPDRRGETKAKDEIILNAVPDRSRTAQAPERLQPTGRWADRAELLKAFETTRAAELALLKETKEDMRSRFEEHPFLKTIDAYQWLLFNAAHGKRHTAQILEVKADPNFPKS